MSTETALFQVELRSRKSASHYVGCLPGYWGGFDSTFNAITMAARQRGLEETCCKWVMSMLESRLVQTSLMGSSLTAKVVGVCPKGRVLSPLLWNLVADPTFGCYQWPRL
jgi:hypothetical protein